MTTPDVGSAARLLPVPDVVRPGAPPSLPKWLGVTRHSDVLVIRIAAEPECVGRAVDLDAVTALLAAVHDDPTLGAVVLTGSSAFADDAGDEDRADAAALRHAIDESRVAVVAAIAGSAMGAGLDLALACRFRVAGASARLGLPAIRRGVLPGTGMVRRLATLLAPADAVELLAYGTTLTAENAKRCGLVDSVADGAVLGAAIAFAMGAAARPPRPKVAGDPVRRFAELRARAERRAPGQIAPLLAIEALDHATRLSAERSSAEVTRLAVVLRHSDQGCAMRYAADVAARILHTDMRREAQGSTAIRSVCLLEPGDGGPELASLIAASGMDVVLSTATPDAADAAVAQRRNRIEVAAGAVPADLLVAGATVTAEQWRRAIAALPPGARTAASPHADPEVRQGAAVLLHPYCPARRVRLVELAGSGDAADDVASLLRRTGLPVLRRPSGAGGVLVDRLRWPMLREAIHLLDEGATPLQVDTALLRFGFAVAPLAALDREGLDSVVAACVEANGPGAAWHRYSPTLDMLHDAGRRGAAVGSGWYRYEADGRTPLPDPAVERLLCGSTMAQRLRRRAVPDTEIVERCLFAAINAAAMALEDGAAEDAASVDAVWTAVLGFPRWRGGLLYHADRLGLAALVAGLRRMHATVGQPAALLVGAAESGAPLT